MAPRLNEPPTAKNRQMEVDATEIRIRAECRLGELLKDRPMNKGGNLATLKQKPTGTKRVPVGTLAESGIDKKPKGRSAVSFWNHR